MDRDILPKFKDSEVGGETGGASLFELLFEDVACSMADAFASHSVQSAAIDKCVQSTLCSRDRIDASR